MAQTEIADTSRSAEPRRGSATQVVIIGAGPYGLASTAHLREAGIETKVFGDPMSFWRDQMPAGMLLRSGWEACHISDPRKRYTLDHFKKIAGRPEGYPVPLNEFISYGSWFQQQAAPHLDRRHVANVEAKNGGFRVLLEDGEEIEARRVVVAGGISPFAWIPPQFRGLPQSLASHISVHRDLSEFAGRQVVVVGGGQSALESAALLHEGGAEVEVIMRRASALWAKPVNVLKRLRKPYGYIFYPPTDVGPLGLSWLVALPDLFRLMPRDYQERLASRSIRPLGANWLRHRVDGVVTITVGRNVVAAVAENDRVRLVMDDGSERTVDHIILGTGYRVDISKYPFLSDTLLGSLRIIDGYPVLTSGLESSVPGLHFVGAPAAWSFGPLLRFVSGTGYAASALTRRIARTASSRRVG